MPTETRLEDRWWRGKKKKEEWIGYTYVDLHSVSLAHILQTFFYFQHNRKLPDSAGRLDKEEKRADAFEGLCSMTLWQKFRDQGG